MTKSLLSEYNVIFVFKFSIISNAIAAVIMTRPNRPDLTRWGVSHDGLSVLNIVFVSSFYYLLRYSFRHTLSSARRRWPSG